MLVTNLDLDLVNTSPTDVVCDSDQFVMGTKTNDGVRASVRHYEH